MPPYRNDSVWQLTRWNSLFRRPPGEFQTQGKTNGNGVFDRTQAKMGHSLSKLFESASVVALEQQQANT
jgi:hypothetical protein